ncbi:unnamed protein product [Polarella glacialis]|uniref:Uncharacterized protein n=1 Tax=Polarella glacialis TaxID=89957 RepID=A0A813DBI2_POLGL|nr:unnamed protein product [Polarella glacialis]
MTVLKVGSGQDAEDASVLEAERQLAQYLGSGGAARQETHARSSRKDLAQVLAARVCALGEEILRQDVELRDLRREATEVPEEVHVLRQENSYLAQHGHQVLEEAAELAARRGSLELEAGQCRQEVAGLQAEREALSAGLSQAEHAEAETRGQLDSATQSLDLERRRGEDWVKSLTLALRQRHRHADDADERATAAEREAILLEASSAAACAEASTSASVASAEAERRRVAAARLGSQFESNLATRRSRAQTEELSEAQAEASIAL